MAAAATMPIFATAMLLQMTCIATSATARDTLPVWPPGAETRCLPPLLNTSDCLAFMEEGSNLTAPGSACCPELAGVVESNLFCLCQVLFPADRPGAKINASRMHELPAACDINISTPTDALCSGDPAGEGIVPINLAPHFDLGPETENSGSYGVRTTGRALLALAIVGMAAMSLSTLFLDS